ncbi:MAG: VCBS repeat-containing protein, partial [Planctomycetes bacterium]|nr:VCBS repeat-containing protein [Planctomycetota bacterium]
DGRDGPDLIIGGIGEVGIWSLLAVFLTKEVVVHAFFFLNRGGGKYPTEPDRDWEVRVPLKFATTAKGFQIGTTLALNFDGDFDGDGRRDLAIRRGNVILDLFRGSAEGVFESEPWKSLTIPDAEPYRYVFPETADLNGDGLSDVLLHYRDWSEKRDALVLLVSRKE